MLYRGRNVKRRNTIQMECHRIANGLIRPGQEMSDDFDLDILEQEVCRKSDGIGREDRGEREEEQAQMGESENALECNRG